MEVTYIREPIEEEVSKVPKWSATSERVLEAIKTKRSVSTVELSRITGYKLGTISAQISILRRMGLIENLNPNVGGQLGIESVGEGKESVEEKSFEKPNPEIKEKVPLIPSHNEIKDMIYEMGKSVDGISEIKHSIENVQLDITSKFPADTIMEGRKILYDTCFWQRKTNQCE